MDLLISEMEKLLASGREKCDFQDIIGESTEKNIDDLLIEADKLISETLPYFQTCTSVNKLKPKDFESVKINSKIETPHPKSHQNYSKKVFFNLKNNTQNIRIPEKRTKTSEIYGKLASNKYILDDERKHRSLKNFTIPEFKVPEVNFMKTQLQVSSAMLENHNRLQIICNKHDKLSNYMETQDHSNELKIKEELNYYKLRNNELEKNLKLKEEEIRNWENRYQQLNQYCELFLKRNVEEKLQNYDYQFNELIEHNMVRESQLHVIISYLLEEIDRSHLQYRIKLSEKNKQIHSYLDQIERILESIHKFRNINTRS